MLPWLQYRIWFLLMHFHFKAEGESPPKDFQNVYSKKAFAPPLPCFIYYLSIFSHCFFGDATFVVNVHLTFWHLLIVWSFVLCHYTVLYLCSDCQIAKHYGNIPFLTKNIYLVTITPYFMIWHCVHSMIAFLSIVDFILGRHPLSI